MTARSRLAALGPPAVPGRLPRHRLRAGSGSRRSAWAEWSIWQRFQWVYIMAFAAAMLAVVVMGTLGPLWRLVTEPAHASPSVPGRLFLVTAVLLLFSGLVWMLRTAGPLTVGRAFGFWLLTAPVRRRDLLRPRFVALIAAAVVLTGVVLVPVAHAAVGSVLITIVVGGLGAVTLTSAAVWAQACAAVDRILHLAGQLMGALSVFGFGSLATGAGRIAVNAALRASPAELSALLVGVIVAALASTWLAYAALDRIDVRALSRGQGLWTAGQVAAVFMDIFLLTAFLAELRLQVAGQAASVRLGPRYGRAVARAEQARIRRRPYVLVRAGLATLAWWGCRPVLPAHMLAVLALLAGYSLALPVASGLQQLAGSPALRAMFAPRERALSLASITACALVAALWSAVVVLGMPASSRGLGLIIFGGITAAVYRTVTRPPLDYSKPPVMTPLGPLPLDLWRQVLRGPLMLTVLALLIR